MSEKLTLSVSEASKALGVGTANMYEICKRSDFPSVRIGKRIVIPVDGLKNWLSSHSGETK